MQKPRKRHIPYEERTKQELINLAERKGIKDARKMAKNKLMKALRSSSNQ